MSNYRVATLLRPIVIMFFPVLLILGLVLNSYLASLAWLLLNAVIAWYTRCRRCGMSIYFDRAHYYRTFLAVPHKSCMTCGSKQD
jgi:hypothetical protein